MNKKHFARKKKPKGSVSIDKHRTRIRLRFTFQKKRFILNTPFVYNESNIITVDGIIRLIEQDIKDECLDMTLVRYKGFFSRTDNDASGGKEKLVVHVTTPSVLNYHSMYRSWLTYKIERKELSKEIPSFYEGAERVLKRWGNIELSKIESQLLSENFKPATFNDRLSVLKTFFSWATKQKLVPYNPLEETNRKKGRKTKDPSRKPFTIEELKLVIDAIENNRFCKRSSAYKHSHYAPFLKFMIYTGVRNAEACGLTVEKVDFEKGVITIDQSLARTRKGSHAAARVLKETKTGNVRYLPMATGLRELLEPLCRDRKPTDFVFRSHKGLSIDDRMFQRRIFKPILTGLGLNQRVLYSLRHSFGTRAVEQGMSLYEVAQLMGHSSIETTMRNYIHLINRPKNLPGL